MGWLIFSLVFLVAGAILIQQVKTKRYIEEKESEYAKRVKGIWLYAGVRDAIGTIVQSERMNRYERRLKVAVDGTVLTVTVFIPPFASRRFEQGWDIALLYNAEAGEVALHPDYYEWLKHRGEVEHQGFGVVHHYLASEEETLQAGGDIGFDASNGSDSSSDNGGDSSSDGGGGSD